MHCDDLSAAEPMSVCWLAYGLSFPLITRQQSWTRYRTSNGDSQSRAKLSSKYLTHRRKCRPWVIRSALTKIWDWRQTSAGQAGTMCVGWCGGWAFLWWKPWIDVRLRPVKPEQCVLADAAVKRKSWTWLPVLIFVWWNRPDIRLFLWHPIFFILIT